MARQVEAFTVHLTQPGKIFNLHRVNPERSTQTLKAGTNYYCYFRLGFTERKQRQTGEAEGECSWGWSSDGINRSKELGLTAESKQVGNRLAGRGWSEHKEAEFKQRDKKNRNCKAWDRSYRCSRRNDLTKTWRKARVDGWWDSGVPASRVQEQAYPRPHTDGHTGTLREGREHRGNIRRGSERGRDHDTTILLIRPPAKCINHLNTGWLWTHTVMSRGLNVVLLGAL